MHRLKCAILRYAMSRKRENLTKTKMRRNALRYVLHKTIIDALHKKRKEKRFFNKFVFTKLHYALKNCAYSKKVI